MDTPSLTKFVMSFFQLIPWLKNIRYIVGLLIILLIVGGIYTKFFKKNNVQQTTIQGDVDKLTIISDRDKVLIPFVEPYLQKESADGFDTGIRAGVRFEW